MSAKDVSDSSSYCSDVQSGKVNMVLPTGNFVCQLPPQPRSHQETSPQQLSRAVQFCQLLSLNQGQPSSHGNWLTPYPAMYAAASPSYAITTDSRRLQGMETTIQYLRELLSKEIINNTKEKKTLEKTKKELEVANEHTRRFEEQLKEAFMKINETVMEKKENTALLQDVFAAQKELYASKKELQDAQSELKTARNIICDLKAENAILKSELAESSKEDCRLARLSPSEQITGEDARASGEENDSATLKSQYEALKQKLDKTVAKKKTVSNQFKELGKKYLYMVEYSGEQMYNMYEEKHAAFIEKLKTLNENPDNETQRDMIIQTLDCLQGQLRLLEDYREDFRVTIELLMDRIDGKIAQVSDLSIRAPKPSLEITLDRFDLLYQVIEGMGRNDDEGLEAQTT